MFERRLSVMIGFIALLGGAFLVSTQERASSPSKKQDQQPIKYEAEEGIPKDKAGEKRRDYAVLEATLNDLASPKNPEYKYHIENVGPGREIVIDDKTCEYDLFIDLADENRNIDGTDKRRIPADLQEDFKRRNKGPARSLADFKPANPNILVRDLDKEFKDSDLFARAFLKKYPTAWGYVWAYPPGYSRDGKAAIVVFEGGPNGIHGLTWVYVLSKKGKRWEVQWRHCHAWE
jgi:hypothetical protein